MFQSKDSELSLLGKLLLINGLILGLICLFVFFYTTSTIRVQSAATAGTICLGIFLAGIAVVFVYGTILSRRLQGLIEETDVASKGNFHDRIEVISKDELGRLATAINSIILNAESSVKRVDNLTTILNKRDQQMKDEIERAKLIEKQVQLSNDILDKMSALVLVTDSNGDVRYSSPSFEKILYYSSKDLLEDGWWKISQPESSGSLDWMRERNRAAKCARREQRIIQQPYERQVLDGQGKRRWILWQDTIGFKDTLIAVGQDITARKLAEEQVREKAALLDITSDAIMVKGLDHQVLYWNRGAELLYGVTQADVLGKRLEDLYDHEDPSTIGIAYTQVIENGTWTGELRHVTKAGKLLVVESSWTLMNDEHGKPKSILVVNGDITEQKQLETQYRRAQRLENIGTLAGGIAHDLNNVLSPIMMSIQALQRRHADERTQQLLATIDMSARRGADIVKQVLTFARGTEGERTLLQPKHILREIEKIVTETFPRSISMKFVVPSDLWTITGDATQLHQIFLNLLVNARDAMPDGGPLVIQAENIVFDEETIRGHLNAKAGNYVALSIRDSGTGIPTEILEKIFDPFFTTKEVGKGTGLGLSTVMSIVRSYGGFIAVDSTVGKGTEFKVYIPATNAVVSKQKATSMEELPVGRGERLLVVDDELSIREITKETLEAYGYRIQTAKDGIEALSILEQSRHKFDLVLTDMMMPNMDGASLIRMLERLVPEVKIVAVSGITDQDVLDKIKQSRIEAFLPKPIQAESLLRMLDTVLHQES